MWRSLLEPQRADPECHDPCPTLLCVLCPPYVPAQNWFPECEVISEDSFKPRLDLPCNHTSCTLGGNYCEAFSYKAFTFVCRVGVWNIMMCTAQVFRWLFRAPGPSSTREQIHTQQYAVVAPFSSHGDCHTQTQKGVFTLICCCSESKARQWD